AISISGPGAKSSSERSSLFGASSFLLYLKSFFLAEAAGLPNSDPNESPLRGAAFETIFACSSSEDFFASCFLARFFAFCSSLAGCSNVYASSASSSSSSGPLCKTEFTNWSISSLTGEGGVKAGGENEEGERIE